MPHKVISNTCRPLICAAVVALLTIGVQARPGSDHKGGERRGPPQQAFTACANLSEGAACGFEGRRGALEGQCVVPPRHPRAPEGSDGANEDNERPDRGQSDSATLVCAPERHRSHRRDDQVTESALAPGDSGTSVGTLLAIAGSRCPV